MNDIHFIFTCIILIVVLLDLVIDIRGARPMKRRAAQMEDARRAVAAAEQLYRGKDKGQDRVRAASQQLLDTHPSMKPTTARMLVEAAVSEAKKLPA